MNDLLYGDNAREMLTTANAGADASFDPPNQNPLDEQLVSEFSARCLLTKKSGNPGAGLNAVPWSQIDAVLRRLGIVF